MGGACAEASSRGRRLHRSRRQALARGEQGRVVLQPRDRGAWGRVLHRVGGSRLGGRVREALGGLPFPFWGQRSFLG